MIKVYGMRTCPDCVSVKKQVAGDDKYLFIDIGDDIGLLKEFLAMRDNNPIFDQVKMLGKVGVPCFVREDNSITLLPEDVGLKTEELPEVMVCGIDGSGC